MQQLAAYQPQKANQVNASLHRLSVQFRIHFKILFKVFKAIHNLAPATELISVISRLLSGLLDPFAKVSFVSHPHF